MLFLPCFQMHVDTSLPLWAFWDIYGNTSKIRLLGSTTDPLVRNSTSSLPGRTSFNSLPQATSTSSTSAAPSNVADRSLISSHHSSVTTTTAAVRTTASAANANTTNSELNSSFGSNGPGEYTVCYENIVDCVLYTCGHMCMCYDCALQQWKGRGQGFCPICRSQIKDVIKSFRS